MSKIWCHSDKYKCPDLPTYVTSSSFRYKAELYISWLLLNQTAYLSVPIKDTCTALWKFFGINAGYPAIFWSLISTNPLSFCPSVYPSTFCLLLLYRGTQNIVLTRCDWLTKGNSSAPKSIFCEFVIKKRYSEFIFSVWTKFGLLLNLVTLRCCIW